MMSDYGVGALGGVVLIDPETGLPYKAEGGGGGGGAVDSVNGQTGAAVLSLQDVVDAGATLSGQVQVIFLDDPESPTKASVLNLQSLQFTDLSSGARASVSPGSIALQGAGIGREIAIYPHEDQDGTLSVSLPSSSGTLALQSDVAAYFSEIPGYDAGETQTLKNVAGVLTWVTDA